MMLFDTDVCIEILRGNSQIILKRKLSDEAVAIAFMTVAELYYGAEKSSNPVKDITLIEEFLLTVHIIQTDLAILKKFASLKHYLNQNGIMLPAGADI
jgi:tRNA(fMet)-specific endonuclease VapC